MITLFDYQQPHHDRLAAILARHPSALDSSDTGTGKTFVAVKVAETLGLRPLIICPKAVIPAWRAALEQSSVQHWAVGNWEMMRGKALPHGRNFFILDEVQRAKGRDSQNAKLAMECAKAGKVLALSATAASNPLEMKALGRILDLYPPGGFWSWTRENGCKKAFFGGMEYKGGVKGMARIHAKIYPHRGARMRIDEIPTFPECATQVDLIDFGDTAAEMQTELQAVDAAAVNDEDPNNPLTIQLRERERTELLKVPGLVGMICDLYEEGKAVVLFTNFTSTIDAIQSRLKIPAVEFSGRNVKDRESNRLSFQAGFHHVILVSIKAGGVGLNLQDENGVRPRVSLVNPCFSVVDYRQALGRIHRAGSKSKAVQKIIFAAGTIEERVAKLLRAKEMNLDALNDSDLDPLNLENSSCTPELNPPVLVPTTMTTVAPSPLKKLSPSGLKYVRLSPCFENDQTGDKTAADEGTMLHAATETGVIPDTFTEEQKSAVQMCIDYAAPLLKNATAVHRELYLTELGDFSPSMRNGKADLLVLHGNTAHLLDWKYGKGAVDDAEENDQVKAYVIALFTRFPGLKAIKAHLVCPRRDEVSTAVFQRSQLMKLSDDLGNLIMTAEMYAERGLTAPHAQTCLFCAKRHSCPAIASKALTIARNYDKEIQLPEEYHPSKVTDPAQMAAMLETASIMDRWVTSARHHFTQEALNGVDIPGYELREKKANRSVDDAVACWLVAKEKIPQDQFIQACSISLPELEKLWVAGAPRGGKGKAKEELMEKLIELGALKQGAPTHYLARIKK